MRTHTGEEESVIKAETGQEDEEQEEPAEVEELCGMVSTIIGRLCAVGLSGFN
jgi:hypothetical protein